jgi:K+-transporting ATPase KdpF subunit
MPAKSFDPGEFVMVENIIVGIVSLGLLVYLFWTLIRPEHF